ncbi:uncharacterized protein EV420DRAFT_1266019, partial [Desarmillaria tabescens]
PILDIQHRIIVYLAGQPRERSEEVKDGVWRAFEGALAQCSVSDADSHHHRGNYTQLSIGISYGGGQKRPGNLRNRPANVHALDQLRTNPWVQRLVGFIDRAYETAFPNLRKEYEKILNNLIQNDSRLRRNWVNSSFAAATFNLGPSTSTFRHRDYLNYVLGMCPVYAGGNFDSKQGGHLILWDLKLVIQFPAGSTIIFPSALLEHSNVPIQPGELRFSFTQFTAAGLFRWVYNGFKSDREIIENGQCVEKVGLQMRKERVWARGLKLFTTRKR